MNKESTISIINLGVNEIYNGNSDSFILTGASCNEDDKILSFKDTQKTIYFDDAVVLKGLTGYCYAWNKSFNGIDEIQYFLVKKDKTIVKI